MYIYSVNNAHSHREDHSDAEKREDVAVEKIVEWLKDSKIKEFPAAKSIPIETKGGIENRFSMPISSVSSSRFYEEGHSSDAVKKEEVNPFEKVEQWLKNTEIKEFPSSNTSTEMKEEKGLEGWRDLHKDSSRWQCKDSKVTTSVSTKTIPTETRARGLDGWRAFHQDPSRWQWDSKGNRPAEE